MSDSETATNSRRHALVIGGSMAGLLAARVLSDRFEQVTLVESDSFPTQPQWRQGVPQSHHGHVLLTKGQQILEQLFPGLQDELAAAGAPRVDWTADCPFLGLFGWTPRFSSDLKTHVTTRNLLEWSIRQRLLGCSNIRFLPSTQVIGLLSDADKTCVTGVKVRSRHSSESTELPANLVVDASGRQSPAPQWLTALGYAPPEETVINSFLGYASRWYQRPAHLQLDWQVLYLLPKTAAPEARCFWCVQLKAIAGLSPSLALPKTIPPTDEPGFLDFARSLRSSVAYDAIKDAQPLSPIYGYRNTENPSTSLRKTFPLSRELYRFR
jgi:2-polyprenyl-6-methoxyphenol hydroxylase-like FAD-dependent oxidoreductase